MIQSIQNDIIAYIESHKATIFENKLKVNMPYDGQLADEKVQDRTFETPAILTLFKGIVDQPFGEGDVVNNTGFLFALVCISDNVASDQSKQQDAYWLLTKVRKLFRGSEIKIGERTFGIKLSGATTEAVSDNLLVYSQMIEVYGIEGEDDDPAN